MHQSRTISQGTSSCDGSGLEQATRVGAGVSDAWANGRDHLVDQPQLLGLLGVHLNGEERRRGGISKYELRVENLVGHHMELQPDDNR